MKRAFIFSALLLACLWVVLLPQPAFAGQLIVNCDNPKAKLHSINEALRLLDPHATNTLLISGTCNESVTVDGFARLTLAGNPTAILDGGSADIALIIRESPNVMVQDMTIQGGAYGVWCQFSLCQLTNLVVQGAGNANVRVAGAQVLAKNCTIKDSGGYGLQVSGNSYVNFSGGALDHNGFMGARVSGKSMLSLSGNISVSNNGADPDVVVSGIHVENNSSLGINWPEANATRTISGNDGGGIVVQIGSVTNIGGVSITNNGASGIQIDSSSVVNMLGAVSISGNAENAVWVGDLSQVRFYGSPLNSVSGNLHCQGMYWVVSGYNQLSPAPPNDCSLP